MIAAAEILAATKDTLCGEGFDYSRWGCYSAFSKKAEIE
jgi:hypothetical protein